MEGRAVVAGAGPAGLSASIGLARLGFQVEVCEERKEWSPRVCGSFLSPEGRAYLQWLGIYDEVVKRSVPSERMRIHAFGKSAGMPLERSGLSGLAIPRKELEDILLNKARSEGVQFRLGQKVSERPPCDVFVAAAGRFSPFRRIKPSPSRGWMAFNVELSGVRQSPGELSLHFLPKAYVGTLTFSNKTTNVSGLIHSSVKERFPDGWNSILNWIRSNDPCLENILSESSPLSSFKGIPALPFGPHLDAEQDYFSVGDNAMVCDPFMGEGISRALGSGPALYGSIKRFENSRDWKKKSIKSFAESWQKTYALRERLGTVIRTAVKNGVTLRVFYELLTRSSVTQSWVLRRIHQGPVWTGPH